MGAIVNVLSDTEVEVGFVDNSGWTTALEVVKKSDLIQLRLELKSSWFSVRYINSSFSVTSKKSFLGLLNAIDIRSFVIIRYRYKREVIGWVFRKIESYLINTTFMDEPSDDSLTALQHWHDTSFAKPATNNYRRVSLWSSCCEVKGT